MLSEKNYMKFFELLDEIIIEGAPYAVKKAELLKFADERDQGNLEELAAWFAE